MPYGFKKVLAGCRDIKMYMDLAGCRVHMGGNVVSGGNYSNVVTTYVVFGRKRRVGRKLQKCSNDVGVVSGGNVVAGGNCRNAVNDVKYFKF